MCESLYWKFWQKLVFKIHAHMVLQKINSSSWHYQNEQKCQVLRRFNEKWPFYWQKTNKFEPFEKGEKICQTVSCVFFLTTPWDYSKNQLYDPNYEDKRKTFSVGPASNLDKESYLPISRDRSKTIMFLLCCKKV